MATPAALAVTFPAALTVTCSTLVVTFVAVLALTSPAASAVTFPAAFAIPHATLAVNFPAALAVAPAATVGKMETAANRETAKEEAESGQTS